jgi:hypothetical protein
MTKYNFDSVALYELYKENKSLTKTAKMLGIKRQTLSSIFKKAGYAVERHPRIYSCNDSFFTSDAPESFYWAGFIAADGCIFNNKKGNTQLKINLSVFDVEHLKKFVDAVNFTGKIENIKWKKKDGVLVRITSKQIVEDLKRFNIVPKKTFIYTLPEWLIDHPLVNHFMRGYFDGDGSVWFTLPKTNKTQVLNFEILGTNSLVNTYTAILNKKCDVNFLIRKKKKIWHGRFSGNQAAQKVRSFLYKDANDTIVLERKRDRFFDQEVETNRRKRKVIGTNLKDGTQLFFNSITDAIKYGFDSHIFDCCNGLRKHNKGYTWQYLD